MHLSRRLDFSNSVLDTCLKFAAQDAGRYVSFVACLGVSETWLYDQNEWHDATFHQLFVTTLLDHFPEAPDLCFEVSRKLYCDGPDRFTGLAEALKTPEFILSMIPQAVDRMNYYNKYLFHLETASAGEKSARFITLHGSPELHILNSWMCDCSKGSIVGIFNSLGYDSPKLEDVRCVKHGDEYCELRVSWKAETSSDSVLTPEMERYASDQETYRLMRLFMQERHDAFQERINDQKKLIGGNGTESEPTRRLTLVKCAAN